VRSGAVCATANPVAAEEGDLATASLRDTAARVRALRAELTRRRLDGFLVPRSDAHQGEYVPPHAQRLAWLTGFTGSAGIALILADRAEIFVDGRYSLQVRDQVDATLFGYRHLIEEPPAKWIEANLGPGQRLGYDPWLHSERQVETLRVATEKAGATLVAVEENPVDATWTDQPEPPASPIRAHPLEYAGCDSAEKREMVAGTLRDRGAAAAVLTLPESIAWLLNVRAGDVAHTPLPLSFAVLHGDGHVDWFVARARVGPALGAHLGNGVSLRAPAEFGAALDALAGGKVKVSADPETAAAWVFERLRAAGAELVAAADPCLLPKARKNEVELAGARAAHRRDGAALVRFLAWLDREMAGRAARGAEGPGEIEVSERLLAFRQAHELFRDLSFDTISGAGPNGAIIHYKATPKTERRLKAGELYLVDSGAQYPDGTTDVTRTVALGAPAAEMRDRFTRVLKGHIALATARFPRGTTGSQLDVLARQPLWQAGLDYDHGTGHGVGSYLGVHEGPQRISKVVNRVALEPGMIVSNEPGYYKTGAYGIRIENLVAVVECPRGEGAELDMLGFETLTLAPIDRRLVEPALMTAAEIAWLDAYHARVWAAHRDALDAETVAWLEAATRPLGR